MSSRLKSFIYHIIDNDTFYTQVFIAVSRNPEFKKLRDKTYVLM